MAHSTGHCDRRDPEEDQILPSTTGGVRAQHSYQICPVKSGIQALPPQRRKGMQGLRIRLLTETVHSDGLSLQLDTD